MANRVETYLTEELLTLLRQETYVSIATVDHESKAPNVNAISWVYAPDEQTVRFSVDNRSKIVENLRNNDNLVISFIANGTTYAISGKGTILEEKMENIPIKLALVECSVHEVRDVMFYGAKMISQPNYEKTYDVEAAAKLDNQVMKEMKRA
ncbi:pyridoxamine 5'-phosphate oxidase family protein [Alteribacillus sp. JSM 102045]|uniref:pyridoxamine 5'-phosphate oxidase family protein n=1 Tax=Alteribacillus sp. JSM 102045 TaxID=1562101 RepID=UPI0035C0C39A